MSNSSRCRVSDRNSPYDPLAGHSEHDTVGFQSANAPFGLSFHAQTCSS